MELSPTKTFPSLNNLREIRYFDENPRDKEWVSHERHFFIITDSSRPVYTRYGNEINITPLLCTIVAFTGQLQRDHQVIQTVMAGDRKMVFYVPIPFIFVCVSSVNYPDALLLKELKILEYVIFSLLTPNISQIIMRSPNFDIKHQTSGAERLFTSALYLMDNYPTFIFNECIPVCYLTNNRDAFKQIFEKNRGDGVYAVVAFCMGDVFTFYEDANFHLTPDDFLILSNNTYPSTDSLANSWTPIWLPSHTDMLHILTVDAADYNMKLIFIANDVDASVECTRMADACLQQMKENKLKQYLQTSDSLVLHLKPIIHYIIVNRQISQVYSPYMAVSKESQLVYKHYARIWDYLKSSSIDGTFYMSTGELTMFGNHSKNETIIAVASPETDYNQSISLLNNLHLYFDPLKKNIFDDGPHQWPKN